MKYISLWLLMAVLTTAVAEDSPPTLTGWGTVVDPDRDCKFTAEDGKLVMTIPKTPYDLTHSQGQERMNAPRVLTDVKGDFEVQVKVRAFSQVDNVESSSGAFRFTSAGLLIWISDKDFIRFERASESGHPFAWVERFEGAKPTTQKLEQIADTDLYLRFTRSGAKLTYEMSNDGTTWALAEAESFELPERLKVGVVAVNTTKAVFSPEFGQLQVKAK